MGKVVIGIGAPHNPGLPSVVSKAGPDHVEGKIYARIRADIEASKPDVVLIFANDHFNTFFLDNFPLFAIGAAEHTAGPNDFTPMPRYEVPVHQGLAAHLHATGIAKEFDLTLTQEFELDHAFMVPVHFIAPHGRLPILPVFVNCFSNPLPLARRAHALGRMIGTAIRDYPEPLRVAVFGSGSFSLEIGGPKIPPRDRSGVPDRAWVSRIVEHLRNGRVAQLIEEATPQQLLRAGNAGGELLNWIAMLGVIGDRKPTELIEQPHGHAFGIWRWE